MGAMSLCQIRLRGTTLSKTIFTRSALMLTAALGALTTAHVAYAQEAASADQLDEIVVTAERRSENLQKVPVSVGVVQGDAVPGGTVSRWRSMT